MKPYNPLVQADLLIKYLSQIGVSISSQHAIEAVAAINGHQNIDSMCYVLVPQVEDRIVVVVDMLGYSDAAEDEANFDKLLRFLLKSCQMESNYIEEQSETSNGNKSYKVFPSTSVHFDSFIFSYPLSGIFDPIAMICQLNRIISSFALQSLEQGFLIRGALTKGKMYHQNGIAFGPPYIKAHQLEKATKMPRICIPNDLVEQWELNIPPKYSKSGGPWIESPDTMLLLREFDDNNAIFSINYIRDLLSINIPPGDSFKQGIVDRVLKIRKLIELNQNSIKSNLKYTEELRQKNLKKWEWFQEQFEKETRIFFKNMSISEENAIC